MNTTLFLIESGRPLELVKQHLAEKARVRRSNLGICHDLGVTSAYLDRMTGVVLGVVFSTSDAREGWKKADRKGVSFPKRGSEWHTRLQAQVGYADPAEVIAGEFNIPVSLGYKDPKTGSSGWRVIGPPLRACGFLWISEDGPYAMWIPDVEGEIAKSNADGFIVEEPANSFKPNIPGCRPMLNEEWEFMCAEHDLKRMRQAHPQGPHSGAAPTPAPAGFPTRIMELLQEVADRKGTATRGPWEDGNGEPLQDDADAAIAWIAAAAARNDVDPKRM